MHCLFHNDKVKQMFVSSFGNITVILYRKNALFVSCFWYTWLFQSKFFFAELQSYFAFTQTSNLLLEPRDVGFSWFYSWCLQVVSELRYGCQYSPYWKLIFSLCICRENLYMYMKVQNYDINLEYYFCLRCHVNCKKKIPLKCPSILMSS